MTIQENLRYNFNHPKGNCFAAVIQSWKNAQRVQNMHKKNNKYNIRDGEIAKNSEVQFNYNTIYIMPKTTHN